VRKSILFGLAALAIMAFAVLPAIAGQSCSDATAKTTSDKTACSASAADKAACTASKEACATAHEANAQSASATCPMAGNCETISISVKGMTCAGCENGLTTALQGTDGVLKVVKISHTENLAVVCVDPTKCKSESLTKLIASKGYEAQVIPAVATSANAVQAGAAGCSTMSKEECAKVCGDKAAAACADKEKEEAKKTDGSL
jgi:copper chaperone CopZ